MTAEGPHLESQMSLLAKSLMMWFVLLVAMLVVTVGMTHALKLSVNLTQHCLMLPRVRPRDVRLCTGHQLIIYLERLYLLAPSTKGLRVDKHSCKLRSHHFYTDRWMTTYFTPMSKAILHHTSGTRVNDQISLLAGPCNNLLLAHTPLLFGFETPVEIGQIPPSNILESRRGIPQPSYKLAQKSVSCQEGLFTL